MPHRNKHQQGGSKSKAESRSDSHRHTGRSHTDAAEQMSSEFPTYSAIAEGGPAGEPWRTSEHRADTTRMNRSMRGSGGTSARRSEDSDEGPARGESTGEIHAEFESEQPARGESAGYDEEPNALWDEAESPRPARGESTSAASGYGDLAMNGFALPTRGESTGRSGRSEVNEASHRGESAGRGGIDSASGGFLEPDEQARGSSRRH